jgi:hypothetical protein
VHKGKRARDETLRRARKKDDGAAGVTSIEAMMMTTSQ